MATRGMLSNRPLLPTAPDAELFVDRGGLVGKIERATDQELNVLLLGDRGTGRTSLLRYLLWRARDREPRRVYVDGARAETAIGLMEDIRDALRIPGRDGGAAGVSYRQARRAELTASSVALEYLQELRDAEPATILLDGLPSADVGHTLFGALRDELWQLPFTWVVAVLPRDRSAVLQPPADAFWDVQLRLDPFSVEESRSLLRARLDDHDLVEEIVRLGNGNPRRQIEAARDVVLSGRSVLDIEQQRAEEELRLQALGRAPYMLMEEIQSLGRPVSASDEELLRIMGWTRQRAARVLQQLESAGFLESFSGETEGQGRPPRMYRVIGTVDE